VGLGIGKILQNLQNAFQERQLRGDNLKSSTIWVWRHGNRDSSHEEEREDQELSG
jgi:hypothetical protein